MSTARLDRTTALPPGVGRPVLPTATGMVHLGVGAFHRSHQAVYTQEAMRASGEMGWGVLGATQRSTTAVDQLRPQGGLFSVLTEGPQRRLDVIGTLTDVVNPASDTPRLLQALASPQVHVVTITVTEKGYTRNDQGGLDLVAVQADLDALAAEHEGHSLGARPATSMVGLLVRGLAARWRSSTSPLTVLSCDNLSSNGHVLHSLVRQGLIAALGGKAQPLLDRLGAHGTFPNSMVDRITPASTPELLAKVSRDLGAADHGAVVAEPFRQWVIEDTFAGPRPRWELAGATLTDDVTPYEAMKLGLLNGTHSVLAYMGALRGLSTIAEAVQDPVAGAVARRYLFEDAVPAVHVPPGVSPAEYGERVLERFAEPALGHTVQQVASDGSLKLPVRWAPTAQARLLAGAVPEGVAAATAAWVRLLHERPEVLVDPRGEELRHMSANASSVQDLLASLVATSLPLGAEVSKNATFIRAVSAALQELPR